MNLKCLFVGHRWKWFWRKKYKICKKCGKKSNFNKSDMEWRLIFIQLEEMQKYLNIGYEAKATCSKCGCDKLIPIPTGKAIKEELVLTKQEAIGIVKEYAKKHNIDLHKKWWDIESIIRKCNSQKVWEEHCKKESTRSLLHFLINRLKIKESELK